MLSNDVSQLDFRRPPRRERRWRRWVPAVLALGVGIGIGAAVVGSRQPAVASPEPSGPTQVVTSTSARVVTSSVPTTVTVVKTAQRPVAAATKSAASTVTATQTVTAVRTTSKLATTTATATIQRTVVETVPVTVVETAAAEPAPETIEATVDNPAPAVQALAAVETKAETGSGAVYFKNCSAARAAGAAPLLVGEPGYRPPLDRDGDGIACE